MTFEEWQATRKAVAPVGVAYDVLKNHFGYVPDDVIGVYEYAPGVLVALKNGQYFTHIGRSEYTGTLEGVERRLWDDHVKQEVE
jgi:hypothetical protein